MNAITRLSTFTSQPSSPYSQVPRYKINITFHSAHNLPVGDIPSFSSDPYVIATLRFPNTNLPKLHHRTPTIRSTREPQWNDSWGVGNVPVTGVLLKVKVMDEDPGDLDDLLGVTRIETGRLDSAEKKVEVTQKLKMGKGAWVGFLRFALCAGGKSGVVEVGINVMHDEDAATEDWWSQHRSPLIGIITHTTAAPAESADPNSTRTPHIQRFEFCATKIQLSGPLPAALKHQYVAFRPIIKTFYTKRGVLGIILNRALKHQYRTIYSYDKATTYGVSQPQDLARKFLDFTHWGAGGRVYTYIITLDGEWRFTETGKEFGIQMLSKHTMHSCVSVYIAFAGEFFIRTPGSTNEEERNGSGSHDHYRRQPSRNVEDYVLVIDNDSGTYRPPKEHISAMQAFMDRALLGLKVEAVDAFDDGHIKEKKEHAAEKERVEGRRRFKQPSSSRSSSSDGGGSISSSDEEELQTGHQGAGRKFKMKAWGKVERSGDVNGKGGGKGKEREVAKVEVGSASGT
ncbi:hypothetical protein K440DRAFT_685052 [Wilcoxina mikolae CBS 423.85]|nr:hypothetical protein K440DRAFT_685052 [Wilcoxina mikolae CBS 423.85]